MNGNGDQRELIVPEGFDDWFHRVFPAEMVHPSSVIRKLGIDKNVVYGAINRGDLDAHKISGRWKFTKPSLRKWLIGWHPLNREK